MKQILPARRALACAAHSIWYDYLSGARNRSEMVSWGVSCLEAGREARHLALLAGLDDEELRAVAELFRLAAASLGLALPEPSDPSASFWMEAYLCRRLLAGTMDELQALHSLYSLWLTAGMGTRHEVWMYLEESIALVRDGFCGIAPFEALTAETVRGTIRCQAAKAIQEKCDAEVETGKVVGRTAH